MLSHQWPMVALSLSHQWPMVALSHSLQCPMVALSQSICYDYLLGWRHRGTVGLHASVSTLQASPVVGRVQPRQSDSVLDVAPCLQQQFNQHGTLHHYEIFPHDYEIRCLVLLSSECNVLPENLKGRPPLQPRLEGAGTQTDRF